MHTDDVRNIPDRILKYARNACGCVNCLENDIYQAMDVGVLIRKKKNGAGQVYRYIDQVCFFDREGQKNKIIMAVTDGKLVLKEFPESLLRRFKREGVDNPLLCSPFGTRHWKGCRQGGGNMIYLVVLSALYAPHLLLKLHWITTVVIGGFLLLRISGHRKCDYRIGDIEEMDEIGYEDYFYGEGLTMIEWAQSD